MSGKWMLIVQINRTSRSDVAVEFRDYRPSLGTTPVRVIRYRGLSPKVNYD